MPLFGHLRVIGMIFASSVGYLFLHFIESIYEYLQQAGFTYKTLTFPSATFLIVFYLSIYISQNFTMVFDTVVESFVFCLIADEEMFLGKDRHCEENMLNFFDKKGEETEKKDLNVEVQQKNIISFNNQEEMITLKPQSAAKSQLKSKNSDDEEDNEDDEEEEDQDSYDSDEDEDEDDLDDFKNMMAKKDSQKRPYQESSDENYSKQKQIRNLNETMGDQSFVIPDNDKTLNQTKIYQEDQDSYERDSIDIE